MNPTNPREAGASPGPSEALRPETARPSIRSFFRTRRALRPDDGSPRRSSPARLLVLALLAAGLAASGCEEDDPVTTPAPPPLLPLGWVGAPESIALVEGEQTTLRLTLTSAVPVDLATLVVGDNVIAVAPEVTDPGRITVEVVAIAVGMANLELEVTHPDYETAVLVIPVVVRGRGTAGTILDAAFVCRSREHMAESFRLLDATMSGSGDPEAQSEWFLARQTARECGRFELGDPITWTGESFVFTGPTSGDQYRFLRVSGQPFSGIPAASREPVSSWWVWNISTTFGRAPEVASATAPATADPVYANPSGRATRR